MAGNDKNNRPKNLWDAPEHLDKKKSEQTHEWTRREKLDKNIESHLSHLKEVSEKTVDKKDVSDNLAYLGGPDNNKKREKNTNRTETPFGAPHPEYDHIGQWIYPTLENAWFTGANTIPALALWFVAPVAVSAKVLSNTPRDLVALLVHPVDEYRNTMDVWKNWMDQNSNTVA